MKNCLEFLTEQEINFMKNLCLNNVEYKRLEDCCIILDNKRKPVTKTARKSGVYPYYGANGIQDYVSDYIFDGVFVLIGEDGSVVNENGNPVVNWAEGKIWVNNHAHIIQEKDGVLLRYIFYFIQTIKIKNLIYGNIPKLTGNNFKSLKISVPSLEIQQKIAEILSTQDKLIELKQKLIDQKKQQKKWLMQNFLTGKIRLKGFEGEWEKVRIGDICKISTGNKNTQDKTDNGKYPFFVRSQTIEHSNSYYYDCEAVLTAGDGVGVGKVFHYINGKFDCHQRVYIINNFSNLSYGKYIFYCFKMFFYNRVKKMSAKNSVDSVRYNMIADMTINLPKIEEQTAIAEILSNQYKEIELLEKELEQEKLKKKALMQFLLKEE